MAPGWTDDRWAIEDLLQNASTALRDDMKRYAAKLLFQFNVLVDDVPAKRRFCEERIIHLPARSVRAALTKAKARGSKEQFRYLNSDGNPVHFEFIGVTDLIELGVVCAPDEVWYEIKERFLPSERRDKFIPPESALCAMRNDESALRTTRRNDSTD